MFRVGQEVVCVRTYEHPWAGLIGIPRDVYPVIGTVYVVTETGSGKVMGEMKPIIRVDGLPYKMDATCFRPVVKRKTDISEFTAMLTDTKINEPV